MGRPKGSKNGSPSKNALEVEVRMDGAGFITGRGTRVGWIMSQSKTRVVLWLTTWGEPRTNADWRAFETTAGATFKGLDIVWAFTRERQIELTNDLDDATAVPV